MYSRWFINSHLRYGTKPLMGRLRSHAMIRRIAGLYAKVMLRPSRNMSFVPDVLEHDGRSVDILWCSMEAKQAGKVILYFHGGGFTIGDAASHGSMVARIAGETGMRAAFVDYARAPEAPYPAGLDDAELAYRALLDRGFQGSDIVLMGDSAGGGMVFGLLQRIAALGLPQPKACVAISPWVDLAMSGPSFRENEASDIMLPKAWMQRSRDAYVGANDPTDPGISPIYGTFRSPPPSFIVCAGDELLTSDSHALRQMLEDSGGAVEFHEEFDLPHVWTFYHGTYPPADRTIGQIGAFVQSHIED